MAGPQGERGVAAAGGEPVRDYAFRVYAIEGDDELRLRDLWDALWRGRRTILVSVLGGGLLAYAASFLITPVFRSEAVIAPVTKTASAGGLAALASQFAGVAALAGVDLGADNRTAEDVATLRSRAFTEEFIRSRNLMPVLFADAWEADTKAWRPGSEPTMWEALRLFDGIRGVDQDVTTGLITVSVTWRDAQQAAEWANGLVADVNSRLRTTAVDETRRNLEYLQAELSKSSLVPVQSTIFSLIEMQMQNAMLANVKLEYAFRTIDPAAVEDKRHWPNRLLLAVLGLVAGGVVGVLMALLRGRAHMRA